MKTKSALSYFGSDSAVASELASMLDHCDHVTVPFCGGLAILPHLKARAVVANDLNNQAINFYRFASGRCGVGAQQLLIARCEKTISHPDELRLAEGYLKSPVSHTDKYPGLSQAWAYWAMCWIGRKGKGGTKSHAGGKPSVRRTAIGGNNATRIRAVANDLDEWVSHFERCEWESTCFRNLLPKVADNPRCGIYCDPPWIGAGGNYVHAFLGVDHIALSEMLHRFKKTAVVIRYGDAELIRKLYENWHIIEAKCRDQANTMKNEIWITNGKV